MKNRIIVASMLTVLSSHLIAQTNSDDIVGIWHTTGKEPAKVQIYKQTGKYFGKIIWLQNPNDDSGKPKTDDKNPDKSKRSTPVMGMVIISNFEFNGMEDWKGGDIYDPESGNTYSSYMYLKDKNTLKLRGYIGLPLFGRTETWSRVN